MYHLIRYGFQLASMGVVSIVVGAPRRASGAGRPIGITRVGVATDFQEHTGPDSRTSGGRVRGFAFAASSMVTDRAL